MTVKVRPYLGRKGEWEVDIRIEYPDGTTQRSRLKAPVSSKSGAQRWGEQRERELLRAWSPEEGKKKKPKKVPTVQAFSERFIVEHCLAERLKPSSVKSTQYILGAHVLPVVGRTRLDAVTTSDVQRLKARMAGKSPKTVNNALSTLSMMLKKAVEWGVIDAMPCTIRQLKTMQDERPFYNFDEYERLVEASSKLGSDEHLIVLLGGDAGLRLGEMLGLEWSRVHFERNVVVISQADWHGQTTTPKGGRIREVPMTQRLAAALKAHRHLKGPRVLLRDDGRTYKRDAVRYVMRRVERRAMMEVTGRVHILRHTFCSHLAMRGASAKAIQELAGHADLTTTMRYMHLSPSAREGAIRLLDSGHPKAASVTPIRAKTVRGFGGILEEATFENENPPKSGG